MQIGLNDEKRKPLLKCFQRSRYTPAVLSVIISTFIYLIRISMPLTWAKQSGSSHTGSFFPQTESLFTGYKVYCYV